VPKRIHGYKREEVRGGCRKLPDDDDINCAIIVLLLNIISVMKSRMRCTWHVVYMAQMRTAYTILVGKLNYRSPLGRPRHIWEDNIKIDLKETVWKVDGWIHLDMDRYQ